jgi:predicted  nucleic acid-binding Zn-ribbon protein
MKEQLVALYTLQQLDSALDVLKKQYAALDTGLAEKAAHEQARAAHKEAETALHTASGALRDVELEQKAVETKRAEYETKLYSGTIHVPKELQAMQDEVEMLGRQRGRLDEKILVLMDELEVARTREAETKRTLKGATAALKAIQSAAKQAAETMVAQARTLSAQRNEAAKAITPALMKRYDSLRAAKGGLAIVRIEDGNACGGCKMGLSSTSVKLVHEGNSIEICDNCRRMLFEVHSIYKG